MKDNILHIVRFILFPVLQILIFNNINLFGYLNPFIYLIPFILLPVHINSIVIMILGFVVGLFIDFFSGVLGVHAAACVLACALRSPIIYAFHNKREIKQNVIPKIRWFGTSQNIFYVLFFVLIHHTTMFFLEAFTFKYFFRTLLLIVSNTVLTSLLIILYQYLFHLEGSKN
ncbi:MAG: hypothetical protein ACOX4D_01960 [Bacteroidales bacterium]|jgi:rod shape-determining protein MreD